MHVRSQKPAVKLHNFFGIICKYVNHNLNNFNIQDGGQNKKQSNIVTEHLQLHTNPFNGNIQRKMPNFIIIYEYNFTLAHENREMQKDCINFNHSMTNGRYRKETKGRNQSPKTGGFRPRREGWNVCVQYCSKVLLQIFSYCCYKKPPSLCFSIQVSNLAPGTFHVN